MGVFLPDGLVHGLPYLPRAFLVHEVAHVDAGAVDEGAVEVGVLHETTEESGGLAAVCSPVLVPVVVGVVEPLDDFVVVWVAVEPHGVVDILDDPTPASALGARSPHHDVVAREVHIIII